MLKLTGHLAVGDELQIDPLAQPVDLEIVDDEVLLHDTAVVVAPRHERAVRSAPCEELLHGLGEGETVREAVVVEPGELFDLVVHLAEPNGLYVALEFLAGGEIVVQLDRADLDDLAPQMDGEAVEYGGFRAHGLVPLQVDDDMCHIWFPLLFHLRLNILTYRREKHNIIIYIKA